MYNCVYHCTYVFVYNDMVHFLTCKVLSSPNSMQSVLCYSVVLQITWDAVWNLVLMDKTVRIR